MPCVLGPTSFYLKIWVNILTIRMLLRSQDEHQNVAVFFIRMLEIHDVLHLGSSWMNVGWISGLAQHVMWDLFEFYPPKSSFSICFKSCWKSRIKWSKSVLDFVQEREDSGLQLQAHASRRFAWFCSEYKLSLMQDLLLLPFSSFYQLHCSWLEACAGVNILTIRMFHLFHLGWFVRLVSGVINPNSEDKTEVQWMQHLGLNSHWNNPSTLMFIVLDEH